MQGRRYLDLFRDGALLGHRVAGAPHRHEVRPLAGARHGTSFRLGKAPGLGARADISPVPRGAPVLVRRARPGCGLPGPSAAGMLRRSTTRRSGEAGEVRRSRALAALSPFGLRMPRVLLPLLPVSVAGAPAPACFAGEVPEAVAASDTIPAFILRRGTARPFRARPRPRTAPRRFANPVVEKAVDDAPGWARTGPYVRAAVSRGRVPPGCTRSSFARACFSAPDIPGRACFPGTAPRARHVSWRISFAGIPGG